MSGIAEIVAVIYTPPGSTPASMPHGCFAVKWRQEGKQFGYLLPLEDALDPAKPMQVEPIRAQEPPASMRQSQSETETIRRTFSQFGSTPLMIQIALHYYAMADDFRDLDAPAIEGAIRAFKAAGLLRDFQPGDTFERRHQPTDGLKLYVETLCATPWPVQRWVVPGKDEAA